uniref:Tetratricopeptide repeat protein n=1 Tax=Planktothricoides sp. SpSt-374 TaxID=2282167 RepID=A0A7C3VRT9_9CYAN
MDLAKFDAFTLQINPGLANTDFNRGLALFRIGNDQADLPDPLILLRLLILIRLIIHSRQPQPNY